MVFPLICKSACCSLIVRLKFLLYELSCIVVGYREGFILKPLIGITSNTSKDDSIGIITRQGTRKQDWHLLADDYIKSVEKAGGAPLIIPVLEEKTSIEKILGTIDGIIFSGGLDLSPIVYGEAPLPGMGLIDPDRDKHELKLGKKVLYEMDIPVLGICRGMQLLNVAAGGTLFQDIKMYRESSFNHSLLDVAPKDYLAHEICISPESKLHKIFYEDKLMVNSFNHQAVKTVGRGFIVTMEANDGLIEGIEIPGERFIVAVQWHPEMLIDSHDFPLDLFREFVNHAINR